MTEEIPRSCLGDTVPNNFDTWGSVYSFSVIIKIYFYLDSFNHWNHHCNNTKNWWHNNICLRLKI